MSVVVVMVCFAGCATSKVDLFPAGTVTITPRKNGACLEQLIERSRHAGYLEKQVDAGRGSFKAEAHAQLGRELRKGSIYAVQRAHMSKSMTLEASLPSDVRGRLVLVRFFDVQCTSTGAVITPMDERGPLAADAVLDAAQAWEIQRYAAQLGAVVSTLKPYAR